MNEKKPDHFNEQRTATTLLIACGIVTTNVRLMFYGKLKSLSMSRAESFLKFQVRKFRILIFLIIEIS